MILPWPPAHLDDSFVRGLCHLECAFAMRFFVSSGNFLVEGHANWLGERRALCAAVSAMAKR